MENEAKQNTDRELWRDEPKDYYAARLFVTDGGGIGIDVGGTVYVKPIREWWHRHHGTHALALRPMIQPVRLEDIDR